MSRLGSIRVLAVALLLFASFLVTTTVRAADDGAAIFKNKCVSCHGADGSSQTSVGKSLKAPDLKSDEVQKLSDADLAAAITKGKGKMPPNASLTPDQAKALVGHVRALAKKK